MFEVPVVDEADNAAAVDEHDGHGGFLSEGLEFDGKTRERGMHGRLLGTH